MTAVASAAMDERLYLAVGRDTKEVKSALLWALSYFSIMAERRSIVFAHVHRSAQYISILGGKFPVSRLKEQQVKAYRQQEREKMEQELDSYHLICERLQIQADKVVIEMEDIGKGLVELIKQHGITKLVMGTTAEKRVSKKMKAPNSKTALYVKQHADPACKLWFLCKGNIICTREAVVQLPSNATLVATSSTPPSQSGQLQSGYLSQSESERESFNRGANILLQPFRQRHGEPNHSCFGMSRSYHVSESASSSVSDDMVTSSGPLSCPKNEDEESGLSISSVYETDEDLRFSSARQDLEDMGLDAEVYVKLQKAFVEIEISKREAYEESCRRQKSERDAILASQKARRSELLYTKEMRERKDVEENLAKLNIELEELRNQQNEISKQLEMEHQQKLELESRIADSIRIINDLKAETSAARHQFDSIQSENVKLLQQRDDAAREAEVLRRDKDQMISSSICSRNILDFTFLEIQEATMGFGSCMKIGEGQHGTIYRGFLRHTSVAVRMLNSNYMQDISLHQQVGFLSGVRHPNLVNLIGVCQEAGALIYEFLPNGSLEDRLVCKENTAPLTWQIRTRIATEICAALIFLHSCKPHPLVHGDLRPENILLDTNYVCKLSDFGFCYLLNQSLTTSSTSQLETYTNSTVYMDPEFITTREWTPLMDIYAFGIILLRLLTGRYEMGIVEDIKEALEMECFHQMIDPLAGDWPFVQANQFANLGLRCCDINPDNRPTLAKEVWRILEPMMRAASLSVAPLSFGAVSQELNNVPCYFICPIMQEMMRDPHIASDGFTYEVEAIRGWFDSGHDTSPMTNLKLPNHVLIPNRALRSAILEWLEQHS